MSDQDPPVGTSAASEARHKVWKAGRLAGLSFPEDFNSFDRTLAGDSAARRSVWKAGRLAGLSFPEDFNSFDRTLAGEKPSDPSFQKPLQPMTTPAPGAAEGASSGGPGGSQAAQSAPPSPSPTPAPKGGRGATPPVGSPLPDGFDAAGDEVISLKNFERRAMNPRQPSIMNKDGSFSTHKMASAEIGGMHIAYPTIVMKGGKLIELGEREAIDHALTTGEFRRFDSDASARKYAEGGYKTGTALTDEAQEKRAKEEETTGSILRYYGRKSDDRAAAGEEMAEFDKHYRTRAGQVIDEPFVHKELLRIGGSIENLDKSLDQVSGLFKETADRIAKDAMAGEGIDRFTLDDGHVDHDEVNKWVGEVRGKYGYQSREVDDQLRQRIERAVRERPIEKLFNKEMEPVLEAIGKERQDAFRQAFGDSPEAMSADSVLLRATNDLARERDQYGALAQTEADQENDRVQQQGGRLKAEYDTNISEIQQAYDTGRIDEATANQMVQAINEAHQAQVSSLAQDNLRRINFINAKYNRAYNQSQQAIVAQADRSIAALQEKFAKTYAEDPALAARLQKEANDAWGRAATKIEGAKATAEQMRRDMAGINAPRDVFIRSTAGAMGSTVAGLGSSAGLDGVRAWGKMLSEANEMPPARTKEFSDWLDLNNLAQITGQVTGSMLPGTVAGGITTIGTGFVGAPAGLSMVMGGLINWGSEAYSASGNIRDEVYAATMDRAKADKAEADLFRSYVDIAPTFAFDMLPFAGKLLGSIGSRAGRMATGAGIELSTELIQERHNQIAEENVREGRDPWEGYSDKILDPKATKETLIQIGPVALMGAAGHITSKSDKQIAAERVADLLAKNSLADVLGNGGISQWMAQMRLRDGDNVVKQAVAALYLGGHIDEKQADLLAALDKDGRLAHDEAVQSMLTSGQAPAYVALRAQGLAMERHAAEMPAGPAQAAAIERAKNMALQAKNIIMGATADYVQVNLPGGTPMVMDVQAATRMLTPEKGAEFALNGVLSNGVSVMGFGKGTGVVAAFQQMVNAAHQKMADELSRARETRAMQQQEFNERHATDRDQARNDEDDDLAERRWMERKRREADAAKTPASTQPKGSLRQDMAAAAANAVAPPPANETNETGGTKTEGTNGGAVTLSPPGTTNRVAALSPEDDALLEDDENDTGSPSTNEPTTTPPAVQGIQGEDQGGAPTAPPDTGAPPGVPPAPEPEATEPVATDLTEDLPDDPKVLADAYYEDHQIWNSNANPEYAMIAAMKGRVKESSYDEWGDPNDKGQQMAKTYFAKKGAKAWGLDQIAQELTEELGREVAPGELAELMRAYQSGLPRTSPRMRQTADRYKAITGKRLTSANGARNLKQKGKAAVKDADTKDFIDLHTDQDGNVNWQGVKDNIHALGFLGYTDEQIRNIEAEADRQLAADTGGGAVLEPVREPEASTGQGRDQEQTIDRKEPWQMTRDEFLDAATLDKEFRKQYAGRSSRTNPSETPIPKVGSWRISKSAGWNKYGDNIEQLREIPIDKVRGAEDPKQEGRQFDVERYAQFMQDGKKPPPISAAEIGDGTFRINDGHRRLAAHEMVGRKTILAWVSPAFDTGLREPSGKIIETDLTHQSAVKKALAEGKPVPSEVLAEYPDLKPQQTSIPEATTVADERVYYPTEKAAMAAAKLRVGQKVPLTKVGREKQRLIVEFGKPDEVVIKKIRPVEYEDGWIVSYDIDGGRGARPDIARAEEVEPQQTSIDQAPVAPADKANSAASRTRPRHAIEFDKPITGPSGASLIGYVWKYEYEEYVDDRGENRIRRVSNWDEAELSDETGRDIVHQFSVKDKDGTYHLVSAEGALRLMGYLGQDGKDARSKMSAAKTLASLMMQRDAIRAEVEAYEAAKKNVDGLARPSIEVIDHTDEETKANEVRYGRQEWRMGDAVIWVAFNRKDGLREDDRRERINTLIQSWKNERLKEMGVSPYLNPSTKLRDVEKKIATKERQLGATVAQQAPAQAEAPLPKKETAAEKRSRELREAERAKKEAKKEATRLADEQDAADARAYESAALFKEGTIPVDEILIMHSPNEGADRKVSYRGPVGKDKSMVVIVGSGHQMAVPNEWLRGGDDFAAREAKRRQYEKEVADQLKFEQQNEFEQKKSAELANAKTYQTRNGWEIVRDGVFYHIRDPHTKEVWYKSGSLNRVREVADETTLETTPTAEVPANAQVPVASPAVEAGAATTVDSITEVSRDNDKSPTQVEYKIPGWEGYTIVVRKRPGGWAMYILKDGNDYEIHGAGKEEPTPRLAAGSGAERLNRNREKVEQMLQGPQQQRPSGKAPVKTGKPRTDRVLKALRALLPDLSIIIPKTQEEYARITEGIKEGLSSGWGVYDPASRRIIVNPASPDLKQTLFHEAAHPVIAALMHNDPARFATFYNEVVAEAGGKYARYGKQYGDQPLSTQQQEALVEYLADVAAGKIDIGKGSLLERIADFLRGIMEALGFKADTIDLSRPDNVRSFARKLSNALNEGITITGLTPSTDPTVMWAKEMGISVEEAQRQYDAVVAQYTNKDGTKKEGWMKAPNGKATNLNERQWVQTRTPAFLNWFGDFLNDPENASKVVDANGEPLVVYHGTKGDFDTFDSGMRGSRHGTTAAKKAFFFTASAEAASNFAGNEGSLMPVFLNVRNVSRSDFTEVAPWDDKTGHRKRNEVVQRAVRAGRDGVMFENMADFGPRSTVVAVFSPNQIKSATANTGQFDTANPNINQQLTDKEGNSIDPSEVAARAKKANLSAARVREIMERNGEDEADIRAVEKAMEEQAGPNVFTMDDADMEDYFDSHFGKKAKGSPGQFSNARNATYFFRDQAHFNQWMGERYAEGDLDGMTEAFSEADSRTKVAYIRDVQKRGDDHEKGWAARMATGAPLPSGRQPVARTTPRPMPQGGVMTGSGGGSTNGPTPPTPRPQRPRTSRVDFNFTALVQLMKEFGNVPRVNKALRTALGRQKGDVTELMKRLLWDEKLATRVLAHEIGHFIDHMIQVTGDKKGFAKRLAPLQQFSTKVNKELKQDAKALSREWRGDFDDADTYRNSASELFADVMSAILNDPEWVNQKFPRIHDAFQHLLDGKPEFAAAYDELTVRISTDAVVQAWMDQQDEARERSIQQITTPNKEHEEGVLGQAQGVFVTPWYHIAHIEGRERSRDIGLTYIDRLEISNIFHLRENAKFESDYNEKVQPWLDRVNPDDRDAAAADLHKYIQANRTIHERRAAGRWFEDNPTEAKELLTRLANMEPALRSFAPDVARLQSGGEAYDLAARMIRVVHDLDGGKEAGPAVKRVAAAIDDMKLGANGEATMVAFNVRGKLLNPGGLTPDTAAGVIAALKDRLEDERFAALEKAQNELSELLYQTQAAAAREGLISDKVFNEVIAPNRGNYAPYAVLDYWGGRVGGRMAEQVGTAKDIADTILATQMKVAAINAWRKHQHIVDLLVRAYRAAGQGKLVTIGEALKDVRDIESIRAKNRGDDKSRLVMYIDGVPHVVEFGDDPGKSFERAYENENYRESLGILAKAPAVLQATMQLFTVLQPTFWLRNIPRGLFTAMGRIGTRNVLKSTFSPTRQMKAIRMAWNYAQAPRGAPMIPEVRDLVDRGILLPPRLSLAMSSDAENQRILMVGGLMMGYDAQRYAGASTAWTRSALKRKVVDNFTLIASMYEAYEKVMNVLTLKGMKHISRQKATGVAVRSGIPKGGVSGRNKMLNLATETAMPWTRVSIQGTRSSLDIWRDPQLGGGFRKRLFFFEVMPRLLNVGIGIGLLKMLLDKFGDDDDDDDEKLGVAGAYREAMQRVSPYKAGLDRMIPVAFYDPHTGKYTSIRSWENSTDVPSHIETVSLRIPSSEEGRTWMPLIYNTLANQFSEMEIAGKSSLSLAGDWATGTLIPGLNPIIDLGVKVGYDMVIQGENPDDDFTHYPMANPLLFNAGWGNGRGEAVAGAALTRLGGPGQLAADALLLSEAIDPRALKATSGRSSQDQTPFAEKLMLLRPFLSYDNAAPRREHVRQKVASEELRGKARSVMSPEVHELYQFYHRNRGRKEKLDAREAVQYEAAASMVKDVWGEATLEHKNTAGETVTDTLNFNFGAPYKLDGTSMSYHIYGRALSAAENKGSKMLLKELRNELDSLSAPYRAVFADPDTYIYAIGGGPKGK